MDLDLNVEMPASQPLANSPSILPSSKLKVMVPSVGRLDILEKKRRLNAALGPAQSDYWSAMLQYLSARISRGEFYEVVIATLGVDNMKLHNDFFCAILYNAISTELPPSKKQPTVPGSSPSLSPIEDNTPLVAVKANPSPILTAELAPLTPNSSMPVLSMNSMAIPANAAHAKLPKTSKKKRLEPVLNPFTQRLAVSQFEQPAPNHPQSELPHLPMQHVGVPGNHRNYLRGEKSPSSNDSVQIRDIMFRRAHEAGIKTVSDDAVSAMIFGVEQHLHKILDQTVKFAISDRTRRMLHDFANWKDRDGSIRVQNLLTAVVKNRGLVGDEWPLIRERVMLHMY